MLRVKKLQSTLFFVALSVLLCIVVQAQDLPAPWVNQDIGDVAAEGSATFADSVFTIKGSGQDIYDQFDSFHFMYQPAKGDCEISAFVSFVNITASDAKACVMIRDSLHESSSFAMTVTCGGPSHGTYFQRRPVEYLGCSNDNLDHHKPAPMWVKLVKVGNVFTASMSEDGTTWNISASKNDIEMGEDFYIGLGVCAKGGNLGDLCEVNFSNVVVDPGEVTSIEELSATVSPEGYQLNQNYPNPFNPTTTINYNIPQADHVVLKVYDLQGKEITTLVNELKSSGQHQISWDGKDYNGLNVTSGVYIYKLIAGNVVKSNKMLLVK